MDWRMRPKGRENLETCLVQKRLAQAPRRRGKGKKGNGKEKEILVEGGRKREKGEGREGSSPAGGSVRGGGGRKKVKFFNPKLGPPETCPPIWMRSKKGDAKR